MANDCMIPAQSGTACLCTTLVFSEWSECRPEGYQTRALIHKEPERCIANLGASNFRRECTPSGLIYNPADTATAPQACEVRIQYVPSKPWQPSDIAPLPAGCDAAGIELAVAVTLAKLLGAKPAP